MQPRGPIINLQIPDTIVALASDSLDKGWNTEKVVKAFVARLERDRMYLKQREAQGKTGDYDKLLQNDMRAMALAAVLLAE